MTAVEELRELVARGIAAREGRPDDWHGMGGIADEKINTACAGLKRRIEDLADRHHQAFRDGDAEWRDEPASHLKSCALGRNVVHRRAELWLRAALNPPRAACPIDPGCTNPSHQHAIPDPTW